MARKALVVKQQKLKEKRKKYYKLVAKCKEEGKEVPDVDRYDPSKYYNRCAITGKTKGYMRDFGVCRQVFREYANKGLIMGVKKASW